MSTSYLETSVETQLENKSIIENEVKQSSQWKRACSKLLKIIFEQSSYSMQLKLRQLSPQWLRMFRELSNKYICDQYLTNQDKVLAFVAHNSWRPEQGSAEWKAVRSKSVGASEISTLRGENKYSKKWELAARKIGESNFQGSKATRWGNVFEAVIEKITENIFGKIYFTGSIPGIKSEHGLLQSASPDGLGVVSVQLLQQLIDEGVLLNPYDVILPDVDTGENTITPIENTVKVLYEFKVPFRRMPKPIIPDNYIPQIKTGMNTCLCDYSVFGDCLMRICSMDNFSMEHTYTRYNEDYRGLSASKPIKMGVVGFYEKIDNAKIDSTLMRTTEDFFVDFQRIRYEYVLGEDNAFAFINDQNINKDSFMEAYKNLNNDIKLFNIEDYGGFEDFEDIHKMFKLGTDTKQVWYSDLSTFDTNTQFLKDQIFEFIQWCIAERWRPLGIMCYKIFDVKFVLMENDPNYVENMRPLLEDFQSKMLDITASPSPIVRRQQLFPEPVKRKYTPRPRKSKFTKKYSNAQMAHLLKK